MSTIAHTPAVRHTGTDERARATQGLRDFAQGLTDFTVDLSVWTPLDDLYAAYERWAAANLPGFVLGRRQFASELKAATCAGTAKRGGQTGFRFVTLRAGLV